MKLDGYRILARCDGADVTLFTRNGLDWTAKFPEVAASLAALDLSDALLDGEAVVLDSHGVSQFHLLQEALSQGRTGGVRYYVFDLLRLAGEPTARQPLEARKDRLAELLQGRQDAHLQLSEHVTGNGPHVFEEASRLGLEGIISKRRSAPYTPGRGRDWLKIKATLQEPFVIGGFTRPSGSRCGFGALLLGRFDDEQRLVYAGRVGTGFDDATLEDLGSRLERMKSATSPFSGENAPRRATGVTWVRPEWLAQIGFAGWTRDQMLRQARFLGLRTDRTSEDLKQDEPENRNDPMTATLPADLRLTHPERVLFPGTGTTKLGLAQYYAQVAEWILPHLADRPLSIVRCPQGVKGPRFFQKHAAAGVPEQVRRVQISDDDPEPYMAVDDLDGLLALVQISTLELHVWGSRTDRLDRPDRLVFDLDPDTAVPWTQVAEAGDEVRTRLHDLGLESFLKTTGGKGLHIVVPIARTIDWATAKEFARGLAGQMAADSPERYVMKVSKAARKGKILVDYLRNDRGSTAVCAYSTRAREEATVSVPIAWEELSPKSTSDAFHVGNTPLRLKRLRRDPWADIDRVKQTITKRLLTGLTKAASGKPRR